jgi:Fic family protein
MLAASRGQTKDRREESIPGSILFGCNWVNLWVDNRVCFPFSSLESVIEHSKEGYDLALRQTQGAIRSDAPDWQPWLSFFLRALQQRVRRLSVKVEREKIALAVLPDLAVAILDYARDHGRVTMGTLIQSTGASRNTLKEHFRNLVEKKLLAQQGGGRSTWYTLP